MSGWDYIKKLQKEDRDTRRKQFANSKTSQPLPTQDEAREYVTQLLDVEDGLTDWEVEFVDKISNWGRDYTDRQLQTIADLHRRING